MDTENTGNRSSHATELEDSDSELVGLSSRP